MMKPKLVYDKNRQGVFGKFTKEHSLVAQEPKFDEKLCI